VAQDSIPRSSGVIALAKSNAKRTDHKILQVYIVLVQVGSACSDRGLRRAWENKHPEMSPTLHTGPSLYDVMTTNSREGFVMSLARVCGKWFCLYGWVLGRRHPGRVTCSVHHKFKVVQRQTGVSCQA